MKIDVASPVLVPSVPAVAPAPRDGAALIIKSGVRAGSRQRLVERLVESTPNEPIC